MNAFARPDSIPVNFKGLPLALAPLIAEKRWVVWRWEPDRNGRPTKVPYRPDQPSAKAASNRPETWGNHATAIKVAAAGQVDGVGYMLADSGLGVFDIDDCRDPESGKVEAWAWDIVDEAQTYTEVTIRGGGLRVIGLGTGTKVHRKQKVAGTSGSIETYRGAERFIVMTGAALPGFDDRLFNIDAVIDGTVAKLDAEARATKEAERTARAAPLNLSAANKRPTNSYASDKLPDGLELLICNGAPEGHRSDQFFHVVGWLKDLGRAPGEIEAVLERYPEGIAAKYEGRLRQEIERAYDRAETRPTPLHRQPKPLDHETKAEPAVIFYGDEDPKPPLYLVRDLLPQTQTAIISGQFSAGKTTVSSDLSYSVMTGEQFAGHEVVRTGAVLWLGAEGASEVDIRLKAAALHRSGDPQLGRLPFARQAFEVPTLTADDALSKLQAIVEATRIGLVTRFPGIELVLIVIDTLASAAAFQDENSASEAQKVMGMLRKLSDHSGALVLVVDHHGKAQETGVRGSSAKSGAADAILAALAEKSVEGEISNRRLAVVKLRSGITGKVIPFSLKPVQVDVWGNTSCGVEWKVDAGAEKREPKAAWSGNARVFKAAIVEAMLQHGEKWVPLAGMPEVKAVPLDKVRSEFKTRYPAETAEAKQTAFKRFLKDAVNRGLVVSKERAGVDWIWFAKDADADADAH